MLTIGLIDAIASEDPKISDTIRKTTANAVDEFELATVLPENLKGCVRDLRSNLDVMKVLMKEAGWTAEICSDRWLWLNNIEAAIDATSEQKWAEIAEVLWQRFCKQREQDETGEVVGNDEVLRKIHEIPGLVIKQRDTDAKWIWQYQGKASETEDWDGKFDNPLDALTHFIKTILEENDRL